MTQLLSSLFSLITFLATWSYANDQQISSPTLNGEKSLYEIGVGTGAFYAPHYPGSNQYRDRYLVLPYFIYRGKVVKADDEGLRGEFLRKRNYRFDLSVAAGFPADSLDNRARRGMPDLDWIGEVGPRVLYILKGSNSGLGSVKLSLPIRAVLSTDFTRIDGRGFVFHPTISIKKEGFFRPHLNIIVRTGMIFATEETMDYFFEVKPIYATNLRSAYDAQAGYLESHIDLALSYRLNHRWVFFGGVQTNFYQGATNYGSPLLKTPNTTSAALGFAWTFYKSKEKAEEWY